jgi:hypothetical protein
VYRPAIRVGRDISKISPELFSLAEKLIRPGDVVWDVGANVGLFTFAAAAKTGPTGKVLAIEPDPWLGTLLRRSAAQEIQSGIFQIKQFEDRPRFAIAGGTAMRCNDDIGCLPEQRNPRESKARDCVDICRPMKHLAALKESPVVSQSQRD